MKGSFTILFWVNKARKSQKSLKLPIYARITVDGKRAEVSTGKSVLIQNWNVESTRVKGNSEEARMLNRYLDNINVKINRIVERMEDNDEIITASKVKNRFLGKDSNRHSLVQLFEVHNEQVKNQIGNGFAEGTFERYKTTLMHLKGHLKTTYLEDDIFVEELKYSFIADFEYYLKARRGVGHNTTMKYLRNFKKIVLLAFKNEWIIRDPFIRFKMSLKEVNKEYLTKEELQMIIEKKFSIERLDQIRDIFVFSCYTGLAYADVQRLAPEDISIGLDGQYWIFINRKKTGVQSHIPLLPAAAEIIEKYKQHPESLERAKLLPVVSNQKVNAYLKEIEELCGIDKKITFHTARHTFATTVTLANGVSIETVSSMLGHKNLRTTQIYAKVVKEKVSNEMNDLKAKLSKKPIIKA